MVKLFKYLMCRPLWQLPLVISCLSLVIGLIALTITKALEHTDLVRKAIHCIIDNFTQMCLLGALVVLLWVVVSVVIYDFEEEP